MSVLVKLRATLYTLLHTHERQCEMCLCVSVSVGYEYESCPGVIQWERRTALMQGFELVPSNLGGWSLDKHHALNIRSGENRQYACVVLVFVIVFSLIDRSIN